jgi:solute carrier family 25 phosphate transporter 23/24/25/41
VRQEYLKELYRHCCDGEDHEAGRGPTFDKFQQFVEDKEEALWHLFNKIDVNNDMLVDTFELQAALAQADIKISAANLQDMVREMNQDGSGQISFADWRDYLLLLPRQTSLQTVYNYWASFSRPRLATSIATQDLDVLLAERPTTAQSSAAHKAQHSTSSLSSLAKGKGRALDQDEETLVDADKEGSHTHSKAQDADEENKPIFEGSAMYLLAGGLAGAVSRTATAPFDRLKVYLINHVDKSPTSLPNLKGTATHPIEAASKIAQTGSKGVGAFASAVRSLYLEGGVHAFFIGNGLNIIKIFPESAVKFWSYEYSKRWFARNVDRSSVKDISGSSRFIAGGIGGVVSQLRK